MLFHALTGTADPTDWWPDMVGPGRAIDTTQHAVIAGPGAGGGPTAAALLADVLDVATGPAHTACA